MDPTYSFDTLVMIYTTTQHHIQEDGELQSPEYIHQSVSSTINKNKAT